MGFDTMMDAKTDLITTMLQCGSLDVDRLIKVLDMGNELFDNNVLADVIDECGSEALHGFNDLMLRLMETITFKLVRELDETGSDDDYYYNTLCSYWGGPFVNYMDSHFNLECLDNWETGVTKDRLLEQLRGEIPMLREG